MPVRQLALLATAIAALHACGGPGTASPDATTRPDATLPDAMLPDATTPDAMLPDATPPDASAPDATCDEPVRTDLCSMRVGDSISCDTLGFGAEPAEGGRPPLAGIAEFLGDQEVVFADRAEGAGMVLSLVELGACGARAVEQRLIDLHMERFFSPSDWSDRFLTHIVPLASDRFAVVATRQRIELFTVRARRIESVARLALDPRDDSIVAVAGRDRRLWTCYGGYAHAYDLSGDRIEPVASADFQLPGGTCRSLTLTADGTTLWIGGTGGLFAVDTTAKPPSLERWLGRQAFSRVLDQGEFLVAQTLLPFGDLGPVLAFRVADLRASSDPHPIARFDPIDKPDRWQRPLGIALVDQGLALETFEVRGQTRTYRLAVHPWTGDGPAATPSSSILLRESHEVGLHLSPLPIVGRGAYVIAQPWRRIVRAAPSAVPEFLSGLHHGAFDEVWSSAPGELVALGPFSVHRASLAADGALTLRRGGQILPVTMSRLRLLRQGGAWRLLGAAGTPSVVQEAGPATLSCLVPGADGVPMPSGVVRLPAGDTLPGPDPTPSLLGVGAGGRIYQLSRASPTTYRLRRFVLPERCNDGMLPPEVDRFIEISTRDEDRIGWALAASPDTAALVIVETLVTEQIGSTRFHLAWLSGPHLDLTARGEVAATTDTPTAVAVAGSDVLLVENQQLVQVVRVRDGAFTLRASVDLSQRAPAHRIAGILGATAGAVYLAVRSNPTGVLTLSLPGLDTIADDATPTTPRSMAWIGQTLVVGMPNALSVRRSVGSSP